MRAINTIRMTTIAALLGLTTIFTNCTADDSAADKHDNTASHTQEDETVDYLNTPFETITGDTTSLADFTGKALLLVNVASECGYTKQYAGLEELYRKFKEQGLVVIGFPANDFMGQEPGTNEEILQFCTSKFDVTFPMMAKISVKGDNKHPLYTYFTEQSSVPGEISWNFNKFLLDRDGKLVARYESAVEPMSAELTGKIEELL